MVQQEGPMDIIDKIRALRAKAESTNNEHEAAAFAAKVQELLAAHNLSMADLAEEDQEQEDVTTEQWNTLYTDPWRRAVARSAARLYMCDMFVHYWIDPKKGTLRTGMTFVGRPHNIIVAREMTEYLIQTTVRLGREYGQGDRAAALGFERGCGDRLSTRLYELWLQQKKGTQRRSETGNPQNLPALYADEAELVKQRMEQEGLKKFGRGSTLNEHSEAGAEAAETISLNTQVGNSRTKLLGAG